MKHAFSNMQILAETMLQLVNQMGCTLFYLEEFESTLYRNGG